MRHDRHPRREGDRSDQRLAIHQMAEFLSLTPKLFPRPVFLLISTLPSTNSTSLKFAPKPRQ